jgi:hypothetical protein
MSARIGDSLGDEDPPIAALRHYPGPNVDIGVFYGAAPPQRDLMGWAQRRRLTLMAARLSPGQGGNGMIVDTYLWDVGVVILNDFHLFTPNGEAWWLVGSGQEIVTLRLTYEGPVATLVRPYRDEQERVRGLAMASELLETSLREV